MIKTVENSKQKLRCHMRALLQAMPVDQKRAAGELVATHVKSWLTKRFDTPVSIALFDALPDEIDTIPLDSVLVELRASCHIPYINQENRLSFTLRECVGPSNDNLRVIFVPGLAFNQLGHRLGRGKGYYDRTLAELKSLGFPCPLLVGLAMDEQIVAEIPLEEHDVAMDYLCTPALGMIRISRN
ncbi:MAG TPA: 5-formyltetrahydrofolate cyclo-ligase [Myxococcota bacterium]|nr:5-formyltetrahydrofolate cyclo-ligase [Myxococcota bacterium]